MVPKLGDHCPSLPNVRCLTNYCFMYFKVILGERVHPICVTPSWLEAEVIPWHYNFECAVSLFFLFLAGAMQLISRISCQSVFCFLKLLGSEIYLSTYASIPWPFASTATLLSCSSGAEWLSVSECNNLVTEREFDKYIWKPYVFHTRIYLVHIFSY